MGLMSTVEEIEQAVAKLSADELARLRRWFEQFEAECFAVKIDVMPGPAGSTGSLRKHLSNFVPAAPASCETFRKQK